MFVHYFATPDSPSAHVGFVHSLPQERSAFFEFVDAPAVFAASKVIDDGEDGHAAAGKREEIAEGEDDGAGGKAPQAQYRRRALHEGSRPLVALTFYVPLGYEL